MSLITTLQFTKTQKMFICKGTHGNYYYIEKVNINEVLPIHFDIRFPLDWVYDDLSVSTLKNYHTIEKECFTGPYYCDECKENGYLNGVFIGYCKTCAQNMKYKRGNGLTNQCGVESTEHVKNPEQFTHHLNHSIWNTYLKHVNENEIGDSILKEDYELYRDLPELMDPEEEYGYDYDTQFIDSEEEEKEEEEEEEDEEEYLQEKKKEIHDYEMESESDPFSCSIF
jgi:hypothetical protein